MTELRMPAAASAAAAREGREGYPFEVCGVMTGTTDGTIATVTRMVSFPNVAEESQRRRRFSIDPISIIRLERELRSTGEKLLGFYHSHPDHPAEPSQTDMEYFRLWPGTIWLIMPVTKGEPGTPRAWFLEKSDAGNAVEIAIRSGGE